MAENLCVINKCHACCDGSIIKLNLIEAAELRNLGTILIGLCFFNGIKNKPRGKSGSAYYEMESSCGSLNQEGLCNLYDSSSKPKSCSSLEPGSKDCLIFRAENNLGELKTSLEIIK